MLRSMRSGAPPGRPPSRIEAGALNDGGSLDELAANLGLSARQLRRAVKQEFGVSPIELAQTQRLLLAKQLLSESNLPIIQVAFASGFESVRRFNALFRSHYRLTPTTMRRLVQVELRRRPGAPHAGLPAAARLAGTAAILERDGRRRESSRSSIRLTCARRRSGKHRGWLKVEPIAGRECAWPSRSPRR